LGVLRQCFCLLVLVMKFSDNKLPVAVIGTAGHIDHGKSALVKALTGIDPDRLLEEKKRGITIELGYAFLDLPSGRRISIIDVPGHERFVKTMAQGASVVQIALLVVDSGEGVKPQTLEHLHILQSMGLKKGVIALTKCDNTDMDLQEIAEGEVKEVTRGTFLENAPIIRTSAVTCQGFEELKQALDKAVSSLGLELEELPLRIPVDRIFSVQGFGTVITGTLTGGKIIEGQEVTLMPLGNSFKVRSIEVHNERVSRASAPCRVALNLPGLNVDREIRGQWITEQGVFEPTTHMLVLLEPMPWVHKEVKLPAFLSMNIGSGIFECRVYASQGLVANKKVIARISLSSPIIARTMDRFILRSPGISSKGYSVVAGGIVIDPVLRGKKVPPLVSAVYSNLQFMKPFDFIITALQIAGSKGLGEKSLFLKTALNKREFDNTVESLTESKKIVKTREGIIFEKGIFDEVCTKAHEVLKNFHNQNPELSGMKREELLGAIIPRVEESLIKTVIDFNVNNGRWKIDGDIIKIAGFAPGADEKITKLSNEIIKICNSNVTNPVSLSELPGLLGESAGNINRAINFLQTSGKVVILEGEFLFMKDFLESFVSKVEKFFSHSIELRISDLKNLVGLSRKYTLPLARYLDDIGVTIRRGEVRIKRGS